MAAPKKPDPKQLGTGMARKAGDAIRGRQSKLDEEIERQSGGGAKKRK